MNSSVLMVSWGMSITDVFSLFCVFACSLVIVKGNRLGYFQVFHFENLFVALSPHQKPFVPVLLVYFRYHNRYRMIDRQIHRLIAFLHLCVFLLSFFNFIYLLL